MRLGLSGPAGETRYYPHCKVFAGDYQSSDCNGQIKIFGIIIPNAEWKQDRSKDDIDRIPTNETFSLTIPDSSLRTLSTNTAAAGDPIEGLLYTPDLHSSDACINASMQYIPANVTRQANLPPTDFHLIAVAPWISANCTLAYLDAARKDPVRAFIFYLPDYNRDDQPPPIRDEKWYLRDGGRWKTANPFPVYAVPGTIGDQLLNHSSHYSGNMTDVEYGHQLTTHQDPRDYARLYTKIETITHQSQPRLWAFLLIVLGVVVFIIAGTATFMQIYARRCRTRLRRRIEQGEVDLEALGIRRLAVPKELLDEMPLFVYVAPEGPAAVSAPAIPPKAMSLRSLRLAPEPGQGETQQSGLSISLARVSSAPEQRSHSPLNGLDRQRSPGDGPEDAGSAEQDHANSPKISPVDSKFPDVKDLPHRSVPLIQPTCPICLDDFIPHQTIVRELPCGHIFNPECIDHFLRRSSSLCPMCKKSALPSGFCPRKITNALVRRERMVRHMRERVELQIDPSQPRPTQWAFWAHYRRGSLTQHFRYHWQRVAERWGAIPLRYLPDLPESGMERTVEQILFSGGGARTARRVRDRPVTRPDGRVELVTPGELIRMRMMERWRARSGQGGEVEAQPEEGGSTPTRWLRIRHSLGRVFSISP